MSEAPKLLSVVESGTHPDFTRLYERLGFAVLREGSMRKALSQLKRSHPAVVVAEFIYSPTYGTKISNLDSLFAGLERLRPVPKLIALIDKADQHHLDKLLEHHRLFARLPQPVREADMEKALRQALAQP